MTAPALTYGHGYLEDFGNLPSLYHATVYTADSGGAPGTTTVDAALTQANDYWNGHYIWYLSGDNAGVTRRITDFDAATDTLTHEAFANQVVAGDTYRLTSFNSTEDGANLDHDIPVFITDQDDFTITVDSVAGNNDSYHSFPSEATGHTTELEVDSDVYTTAVFRYKTSSLSIKAKIVLEFHGGTTQTILDQTGSTSDAYGIVDITASKTIDHIRLHADEATGSVGYDFVLLCKDNYSLPQYSSVSYSGLSKNPTLRIPGRATDISHYMGSGNLAVEIVGDIDHENTNWKRTGDTYAGDVFLDLYHNAKDEAFQWLTCDRGSFKVSIDAIDFTESNQTAFMFAYILRLKEYMRGPANNMSYSERFGIA